MTTNREPESLCFKEFFFGHKIFINQNCIVSVCAVVRLGWCPFIILSFCSFVILSYCLFVHLLFCLFVLMSIYYFVCLYFCPFILMYVCTFVHLFLCLLELLSIYSNVCWYYCHFMLLSIYCCLFCVCLLSIPTLFPFLILMSFLHCVCLILSFWSFAFHILSKFCLFSEGSATHNKLKWKWYKIVLPLTWWRAFVQNLSGQSRPLFLSFCFFLYSWQ